MIDYFTLVIFFQGFRAGLNDLSDEDCGGPDAVRGWDVRGWLWRSAD